MSYDDLHSDFEGSHQEPSEVTTQYHIHQDSPSQDPWNQGGAQPPEPPRKKKKSHTWPKAVALGLCCALVGGIVGGGSAWLVSSRTKTDTTIYEGQHTPVDVQSTTVKTGDKLTPEQIYAQNINASVGITTELVGTNSFGFPVSGAAAGSGFVISPDGYIVTNYHVIKGATSIKVAFQNGQSLEAKLVGGEAQNDVAVLKVDASGLPTVTLGNSDELVVGESVYTIGNPLGELTWSFSNGLVSAIDRTVTTSEGETMNMIQTNTTINSGNSGGPLFNSYGEVVGITSAKMTGGNGGGVEGLGFAIPINDVEGMIEDIIQHGYVTGKPNLGILMNDVSPAAVRYGVPAGSFVEAVLPGSCADQGGILASDIITALDGEEAESGDALKTMLREKKAGDQITLTVYREGGPVDLTITLDEDNRERQDALSDLRDQLAKQRQEEREAEMQQGGGQPMSPDEFFSGWPFFGFGN